MAAAVLWASALSLLAMEAVAADWPCSGRDIHNTRNADDEHVLDSSRIAELRPLWTLTTDRNVAATPAVMDGLVYATDFGGSLWAVDAATGQIIWKNAIGSYTGVPGDVSRTTPADWQGALIMGDGAQAANTQEGAIVFALDAKSGRPKWRTKVEADPAAMITSAPDGDGHSGILFQNASSRQIAIWEMNGLNVIGGGVVSADTGPSWRAIGTGGEGASEILFQSKSGQAAIWDMNRTNIVGGGAPSAPIPDRAGERSGLT
ncbi:MAG TPA: PQQ-binding-like beta-propeller repeat protein [Bradyrhizobium sp.]|nr:PQQ-binding-like beta-propeller repeat protein [Bradyrhizobium sp.]